jgi:hypothetical protein
VSALSDLLDAQNNFMSVWVNYEALRRSLDLDLGTLQLDSEGLWIDPGPIREDYGTHDPWLWRCPENPYVCYDGPTEIPVSANPQPGDFGGELLEVPSYLLEGETIPAPSPRGPVVPGPAVHGPSLNSVKPRNAQPAPYIRPLPLPAPAEVLPPPQETNREAPAEPMKQGGPILGPALDPAEDSGAETVSPASATEEVSPQSGPAHEGIKRVLKTLRQ